ncbi:hypothetical protein A11A3_12138 [Alcanivorax hongdengensis A-11-3]|uniref:PepSY-associated TM helix domain-containing protein n=1 Tax=Alcanivorax hongdengensis A-11-3 TaxID=1177179 RepID=L0WC86_9GAMM|nr:PepSY-associated TM helix domain-containing protein [Alcanivorax hongdengensis]EKF73712.1 hypothetical protein A11A3_12138 [Alcanivorax hongdengensis A-11-3]
MKADRMRRYVDLHSWLGMVAGLALFVAFFAGALNMFHEEIHHWQTPRTELANAGTVQGLLQQVTASSEDARQRIYLLPGADPGAMWFQSGQDGAPGEWVTAYSSDFNAAGERGDRPHSGLADFVNQLHYQLAIPTVGLTLMGIISILYGAALFTGLVIHWPKLRREFFALRHQGNVRRYWKNLHNLIGVLCFPFHLIMSVTGAAMGAFTLIALVMGALVFGPQLQGVIDKETQVWPAPTLTGEPTEMAPVQRYLDRARQAHPDLTVDWIEVRGYGDQAAWVDVAASIPGVVGHHIHVLMDARAQLIRVIEPGHRSFNYDTLSPMYALHFGDYGGSLVQWLYFAMGLLGALLFVSGNILWCERRTDRNGPSRSSVFLLRLTLGVCFGVVIGLAGSFLASKLLPYTPWGAEIAVLEKGVFLALLLVLVVAGLRSVPLRFSRWMLTLAPLAYLAVPLLQLVLEGRYAWVVPDNLTVNVMLLLVALSLWVVRALLIARLRRAEPHPLWQEGPLPRSDQAVQTVTVK